MSEAELPGRAATADPIQPWASIYSDWQGARRERGGVLFWPVCALVGLWALFQQFYKIGTAPIVGDEPVYVSSGWNYLHGGVHSPPVHSRSLIPAPGNFEHTPLAKYLFGLAQLVSGTPRDLTASRCVSAAAAVLTAVLVGIWLARLTDRWTGLLAAGLLTVLPQPAGGSDGRFSRFAMLDPVAMLFMVLSVVVAWEWSRRSGRSAWRWAVLTGVAVALAAGAKENGFLGVVGPMAAVLVAAVRSRDRSLMRARLAQAVAAIVVAVVGLAALYLPISDPVRAVRYLIRFQSEHSANGHLVGFAGRVTTRPPWWANLWYAGHGYGAALTCFIVASALYALLARRDALAGWCAAAMAFPFVFHCFLAHVALGYYWVMWTPMVLTLAALGAAELIRQAAGVPRLRRATAVAVGVAVLAVPVVDSVSDSVATAGIHHEGAQKLPAVMAEYHLHGPIVNTGVAGWAFSYYLPGVRIVDTADVSVHADTIVVAAPQCRDPLDPGVRALVAANEATGHVRQVYSDRTMTVYAVVGPLAAPSPPQIAAEPVSRVTDKC